MLATRVMPCLLLDDGRLVKTIKFKKPSYVGDPINAIKIFNEKEVDELILVDITATPENRRPPFDIIEELADECFMPFTYGGGIRSLGDIKTIHGLGVEKIAINSMAAENPDFIRQAAALFGSQSVVVSIDVKKNMWGKYTVYSRGGRQSTGVDPVSYARNMEELGAGEILLNAIDRDGTMGGFDVALIKMVAEAVTIPLIALGGAGCVDDLAAGVIEGKASAVAAGSLFVYQGKNRAVLINFPSRQELEQRLE